MYQTRQQSQNKILEDRNKLQQELARLILLSDDLKEDFSDNVEGVLELFGITPNEIPVALQKEIIDKTKQNVSHIKKNLTDDYTIKASSNYSNGFEVSTNIEQYKSYLSLIKNAESLVIIEHLKEELKSLIDKSNQLLNRYHEKKTGVSSLLNGFGLLSNTLPNQYRINAIHEIQRVVKIVSTFLSSNREIKLNLSMDTSSKFDLKAEINQYKNLILQINGVVLTEISNINGLIGSNSELSSLLKEMVSVPKKEESLSKEKYQLLLISSPKPEVISDEDRVSLIV